MLILNSFISVCLSSLGCRYRRRYRLSKLHQGPCKAVCQVERRRCFLLLSFHRFQPRARSPEKYTSVKESLLPTVNKPSKSNAFVTVGKMLFCLNKRQSYRMTLLLRETKPSMLILYEARKFLDKCALF